MPGTPTTKWGLVPSAGTDQGMTIDNQQATTYALIDTLLAPWSTGLLSARPVSTVGSPGKAGRRYFATDVGSFGCEYVDLGTSWKPTSDEVKIAEITLGSAGLIDFTSITQQFRHLRVVGLTDSTRVAVGATTCGIGMRANNDGTLNYNSGLQVVTTNPTPPVTTAPEQAVNYSAGIIGHQNLNAPASPGSSFEVLIPRYSVTGAKPWTSRSSQAAPTLGIIATQGGGVWGGTGAITRLTFGDDQFTNLITGSTISLYGIV